MEKNEITLRAYAILNLAVEDSIIRGIDLCFVKSFLRNATTSKREASNMASVIHDEVMNHLISILKMGDEP